MSNDDLVSSNSYLQELRDKRADVTNRLSGPASLAQSVANMTPPPPAATVWGTNRNAAKIRAQGQVVSAVNELVSKTKGLIMAQGDLATVNYDLTQMLEIKKQGTMLAREETREIEHTVSIRDSRRNDEATIRERSLKLSELQLLEAEERLREIRLQNDKLEAEALAKRRMAENFDPNNAETAVIFEAMNGSSDGTASAADQVGKIRKTNAEVDAINQESRRKEQEAKTAQYNAEISLANKEKTLRELNED